MNIDLTDREIELLMGAIGTNIETIKRRHDPADAMIADLINELFELEDDLREALHRRDDGWGDPDDPDLLMDPVDFAAKHDIDPSALMICDAEINAETATSRAAGRRARALNFRVRREDDDRSEAQDHDVWAKPTHDPIDW